MSMRIQAELQPGTQSELDAKPDQFHGREGWRIKIPDKGDVFIYEQDGRWRTEDKLDLNDTSIQNLGQAIKPM